MEWSDKKTGLHSVWGSPLYFTSILEERAWLGWKKFLELSKLSDGFIESDTLIIKAQVQVIREKVDRPFRCLDRQYRRELVRTKQTGELDRRQSYVVKLPCFLFGVKPKCQTPNVQGEARCDFESSCEALLYREGSDIYFVKPAPIVRVEKDMFVLVGDVLVLLERAAALEPLQLKDEKGPQNQSKKASFFLTYSNKIEVAYQEAVALKRQEELIQGVN
ncbi:hypothetical protein GOBAR_DD34914 [Gossypium barbadense]|nr:hypothetical protein GOBAR_DD34914 [Gossypium barbadense]